MAPAAQHRSTAQVQYMELKDIIQSKAALAQFIAADFKAVQPDRKELLSQNYSCYSMSLIGNRTKALKAIS
jgi:hypothetical protein